MSTPDFDQTEADNPLGSGPLAETLQASGLLRLDSSATPEAIQSALENLRELATGSEPGDLVFLRKGAVDALKDKNGVGMGHHDATALVGAVLPKGGQGKGEAKELHGHAIALTDPEPWPDPVTGEEVLAELVRTLAHYLALSAGEQRLAPCGFFLHTLTTLCKSLPSSR